jgi:hypothetical protein
VAGHTFTLINGIMFRQSTFLPVDRISMTIAAEAYHRFLDELCLFRSMWVMAADAASAAHHGPVHLILAVYFSHSVVMTTTAQFVSRCLNRKRSL